MFVSVLPGCWFTLFTPGTQTTKRIPLDASLRFAYQSIREQHFTAASRH